MKDVKKFHWIRVSVGNEEFRHWSGALTPHCIAGLDVDKRWTSWILRLTSG